MNVMKLLVNAVMVLVTLVAVARCAPIPCAGGGTWCQNAGLEGGN